LCPAQQGDFEARPPRSGSSPPAARIPTGLVAARLWAARGASAVMDMRAERLCSCVCADLQRKGAPMDDQTSTTPDPVEARERLWDMIKDIKFAMFTTRHSGNGHLHARPMTTQNKDINENASLWFFMSRGEEAVADLRN